MLPFWMAYENDASSNARCDSMTYRTPSSSSRVGPRGRETRRPHAVDRIVEVLGAVARRLDDNHALVAGVPDGGPIVLPPLDRDVAPLIVTLLKVVTRTGPVQLDQDDVSGAQQIGGVADGFRRALSGSEDRDGARVRVGRDARHAEAVLVAAEDADDRRAVIAPVERRALRAADDAALDLLQVFVVEPPRAFDIDDADAVALAARLGVRPQRFDPAGCGAEIHLARDEARGWRTAPLRGPQADRR
jgi:hypothetical protein